MVSVPASERSLELLRFESAAAFAEAVTPFLLEHEVEHGLLLGLTARLKANLKPYGQAPYLALVRTAPSVLVASLIVPPRGLVISRADDIEAIRVLASDVWQQHPMLPDVNGPRAASLAFASTWQELSGRAFHLVSAMRIYRADEIIPPANVAGTLRRATHDDRPLLIEWMDAFVAEWHPESDERHTVPADVDQRLFGDESGWFLWEDQQPVSLVGFAGPTTHGIRVGPVYTPPAHRGHGYASAATAAVTQHLLASGRQFCFLYTDVSNATANKIDPTIGYRLVGDVEFYGFDRT
jgi:predicted GNAT family acetyltransferase